MASEASQENSRMEETQAVVPDATAATRTEAPGKKRPRIDLTIDGRERKRGKSMFGLLVGTLNKAKKEDQDRNASEAAKKRADIDRRLLAQRAEETDHVRRLEELKRDRQTANRKEEELKLRQSIYQCRRTRLPALANYLLTSDDIPLDDSEMSSPSTNALAPPPRTHPPPLYYSPVVLLPSQAAFLERRRQEVKEATEKEWQDWLTQRQESYVEVDKLRARIEEEEKRQQETQGADEPSQRMRSEEPKSAIEKDDKMDESVDIVATNNDKDQGKEMPSVKASDGETEKGKEKERDSTKEGDVAMVADGDDAVEY